MPSEPLVPISDERLIDLVTGATWPITMLESLNMARELLAARAELNRLRWRKITPEDLPEKYDGSIGKECPTVVAMLNKGKRDECLIQYDLMTTEWIRQTPEGYSQYFVVAPPTD